MSHTWRTYTAFFTVDSQLPDYESLVCLRNGLWIGETQLVWEMRSLHVQLSNRSHSKEGTGAAYWEIVPD